MPPCLRIGYYRLNARRGVVSKRAVSPYGQVAFLAMNTDTPVPHYQRLKLTNILHKALIKLTDGALQVVGKDDEGEFLDNENCLYFFPEVSGEYIVAIRVVCMKQIDDDIIHALRQIKYLELDERINVRLMGVGEYVPQRASRFKTMTPALVSTEVRNNIHRSAAAIFINNVRHQRGLTKTKDFSLEDGWVVSHLDDDGWIRCRALETDGMESPIRGTRIAASNQGYFVEVEVEKPMVLLSLGQHSRFGAGMCMPKS